MMVRVANNTNKRRGDIIHHKFLTSLFVPLSVLGCLIKSLVVPNHTIVHLIRSLSVASISTMISIALSSLRTAAASPAACSANRHLSMACASSIDKLNNILEEYRQKK